MVLMQPAAKVCQRNVGTTRKASQTTLAEDRLGAGPKPDTTLPRVLGKGHVPTPGDFPVRVVLGADNVGLRALLDPSHAVHT